MKEEMELKEDPVERLQVIFYFMFFFALML